MVANQYEPSCPDAARILPSSAVPQWRKSLLALGLALALPAGAQATTYYVDSINGADNKDGKSEANAWKNLTNVNATTFVGGDTILFKRGCSWTGLLNPPGSGGSSSTSRVVFDAYGTGTNPLIIGVAPNNKAVNFANKQYLTFQNFRVTFSDPDGQPSYEGYRIGIRVAWGGTLPANNGVTYHFNDVKILNNEVFDVHGFTVRGDGIIYSTAAIYAEMISDSGANVHVDGFAVEDNYLHDNRCIGFNMKAAVNYAGREDLWATNFVFRGNVIAQGGADGFVINGAKGALIESNACYDAGILTAPDPNQYIAGMWSCVHTRDILFQFNEVARTCNQNVTGKVGDSQAFDADIYTYGEHVFQYNYTHENEGGILIMMPDKDAPLAKTVIYRYNLSVNDRRRTNAGCQFAISTTPGVNSAYVYNNVLYTTRPEGFKFKDFGATHYYNNVIYSPSAIYPTKPTFSNNCYFGHTPDVTDHYKVLADPKFVGPLPGAVAADEFIPATVDMFKLQATSPCINKGRTIPTMTPPLIRTISQDFWNNPLFSGGTPDIGAHEVVGGGATPPTPVTIVDGAPGASVTYSSGWTHAADAAYYSNTKSTSLAAGSYVQHVFSGTNVGLFGRRGPDMGKLAVSYDGGASVEVDLYWPVEQQQVLLYQISNLSNTSHTLKAIAMPRNPLSSSRVVAIDYFVKQPATPATWFAPVRFDNTPAAPVAYTGTWTHNTNDTKYYGKTYSTSSTIGSGMTFTFTGTGVRIYGTKGFDQGKLNVSIDGGAATSVNCFQPLIPDHLVRIYEVTGLPPGTHTLQATVAAKDAASTGNTVSIDLVESLIANVGGAVADVIVDNASTSGYTTTGTWTVVSGIGYSGSYARGDDASNAILRTARFTPVLPVAGNYEVFARWVAFNNRADNTPFDIASTTGTVRVRKDQRGSDGVWVSLGIYNFEAGTAGSVTVSNDAATGYVIADAVRFVKQTSVEVILDNADAVGITKTNTWDSTTTVGDHYFSDCIHDRNELKGSKSVLFTPTLPSAGVYEVFAWWSVHGNRSTVVPFDIIHANGTATTIQDQRDPLKGGGRWVSLGSYSFTAGTAGKVLIRTHSTTDGYVIADAVRFLKR